MRRNNIYMLYSIIYAHISISAGCGNDRSSESTVAEPDITMDTLSVLAVVGQELGDATNTFGSILDAEIDGNGRLYVLDGGSATLKAFNLEGDFLQIVSRAGPGPGELMNPRSVSAMPDGRLIICEPSRNGIVVFDDSLQHQQDISLWPQNSPYSVSAVTNDLMAICRYDENPENNYIRHTIGLYQWGSEVPCQILWKDSLELNPAGRADEILAGLQFTLFKRLETSRDESGNIYFAPRDSHQYTVLGWDSCGVEFLRISIDISPVEKTQAEIDSESLYMNSFFSSMSGSPSPFEFRPDPFRVLVESVGIGPDSLLWVRRGTSLALLFDRYDLSGELIGQSIYPVESTSWKTVITSKGVLAWELDPYEGFQRIYLIGNETTSDIQE